MRVKSPIRSTRVRSVRSPVSGSPGQLLPNKSEAVAYFKGSPVVDTIGLSTITPFVYIPTFAGTETLTLAHLTGSETVSDSVGTSTATVNAGSISFTAGTMGYLLLSDGTELILEGDPSKNQSTVYNIDGTGRHGTLVGAASAPFSTPSSDVSYLATHGGSFDFPFGSELNGTAMGTNATNQIIDLGNNTYRFVGDGSSYSYVIFSTAKAGERYYIEPFVVESISGEVKANDATDSDIYSKFSTTPDPVIRQLSTNGINFGRATSGQAIDITIKFVVKSVVDGVTPAVGAVDVYGNELQFRMPWDIGYPGYLNISATAELVAADNLLSTPFLFNTGVPNDLTPEDFLRFAGGSLEHVMFVGPRGLAIYSIVLDKTTGPKAARALGNSSTLTIGMFTDPHAWQTNNIDWAADELNDRGVAAVMCAGDNYRASIVGDDWTTLTEMTDDIATYEGLFDFTRTTAFATGNHDYPMYGSFSDFWAESTLVQKNSVHIWWDIAVINIFTAGTPDYTVDAETLTFLATELENARLRGNRIILLTHLGVYDTIQAADVMSALSTAKSNGAEILLIVSGHAHVYSEATVLGDITQYTLGGLRNDKIAYLLNITPSGYSISEITG